ncbi:MAG: biotin--[acetyl-CoA-carboxylase] ligase [Bacteroidota bacterium]
MSSINNSLFVGKVRHHFSQLPSTNLYATELLSKSKPPEGTIITTDEQTDGRGQIGSRWESEAGSNITLSAILYPRFLLARDQFCLNMAISLAVADCIRQVLPAGSPPAALRIKWPNDIYYLQYKIAGILIQNQLSGSSIQSSVVGIGINVNQQDFDDAIPNAGSLRRISGKQYEIESLIPILCAQLEHRYLQLRQQRRDLLRTNYLENLFQYQQEAWYADAQGHRFRGRVVGVDPSGKLQVERGGHVHAFEIKQIRFLINSTA